MPRPTAWDLAHREDTITVTELAKRAGVSRWRIHQWIKRGIGPKHRLVGGGRLRILKINAEQWLLKLEEKKQRRINQLNSKREKTLARYYDTPKSTPQAF